jgi:predicted membrane-bound spermidine synthase
VLVGGLGMGFTLRATLDVMPPDATVVVSELMPAVVEWNRGPLGALTEYALDDRRVQVEIGDVLTTLREGVGRFDAILLDVDNGPDWTVDPQPEGLMGIAGTTTYRFRAKQTGTTTLEFAYRRAWDDGAAPVKVVRYDVTVRKAAFFDLF